MSLPKCLLNSFNLLWFTSLAKCEIAFETLRDLLRTGECKSVLRNVFNHQFCPKWGKQWSEIKLNPSENRISSLDVPLSEKRNDRQYYCCSGTLKRYKLMNKGLLHHTIIHLKSASIIRNIFKSGDMIKNRECKCLM